MNRPEILSPAGNFEKLKTAIYYGADAVYLGGKAFSLRAQADNFTEEEIANWTIMFCNHISSAPYGGHLLRQSYTSE